MRYFHFLMAHFTLSKPDQMPRAWCQSGGTSCQSTRRMPSRANALGPASWTPLLRNIGSDANILADGMHHTIITRLEQILSDWQSDLPHGIIHADLFPNNVLFVGDKLTGIIDFYFACEDMFAYDIGICLNSWCFEADRSFNVTKSRALFRAMNLRRLSVAEKQAIPVLAAGSAMRFPDPSL